MSDQTTAPLAPEDFATRANVSRETLARLEVYVALLRDWNTRHNLVSDTSLEDVWRRHVLDSAQLAPLVPQNTKTMADLGSGAGFPGLVLAELLRGRVAVALVESTRKKCDFLMAAAAAMALPVTVVNARIEAGGQGRFDVVTARALAPLDKLLGYAQQISDKRSVCLFLKGQSLASELTEARKSWRMKTLQHPSATDPSGVILEVRELEHVRAKSKR
ncbi:MAG TPA: 16S rRNA (guanine(527)-N(7))-methyltransferase RsmG [Rhizomicrobium sp.]|jgi:16S rRNA (guanine527-N7)-methyltransferase|nr:16S rRNA (guanine(527)-N(7))-methyltransferase RsmG [Rhizomicrobium sp.]